MCRGACFAMWMLKLDSLSFQSNGYTPMMSHLNVQEVETAPVSLPGPGPLKDHVPAEFLWDEGLTAAFAGFAPQGHSVQAYTEDAFQYFLEMERRRSEASNRPFVLMLIDL